MKKLTIALLFTAAFASAQTTLTYTAPIGSIHCSNRVGQLPAVNHGCPMFGFVGQTGTQTGNFQTQGLTDGSDFLVFRIVPGVYPYEEVVEGNGSWSPLSTIPPAGTPVTFTFNATISNVCLEECLAASGTFQLQGDFSWQYVTVCRRSCTIFQEWKNTSPVIVTIIDASTVAILD